MDREELKKKIEILAQFPYKERSKPYQSYYLDGEYMPGTRDTLYRYNIMQISQDMSGMSVLDLGSQLGSMSIEAYRRGARNILGIEYQREYIECAKTLAEYNRFEIDFVYGNLMMPIDVVKYINNYFKVGIDIVFALSLTKHIGVYNLYWLLKNIDFRICYLEGHNCNRDLNTAHCQDMFKNLVKHFKHDFIGFSEDRSIRPIWRLYEI